ncbi:MAG TPA: GNAT family N-acetyltransferase [Baekduia sp.]|uniref:GNAT family N-acetyltransferase n=1 Tax=Baekduia sp. TaxID=2600305 RepID=UPI002D780C17|nr:GNAT family N-acetyltransferase [Baekduia sp.]HET6508439.1 GNAT family N-acetyltransferase [Baekduia sp.]
MDDEELARRSIRGFAEMVARLDGAGTDNPWIDATVDEGDAYAIWSRGNRVRGRVEDPSLAMPVLGLELAGTDLDGGERDAAAPSMEVVGRINDRAYEQGDVLRPLFIAADGAPGLAAHGIRVDGAWACVLLMLRVEDDVAVHFVATESDFRRRGLASRLIRAALADARADGASTATLQASPDGLPVYERLGFRRVATLRAFLRPGRIA